MQDELLTYWHPSLERCGYIDAENGIFELKNTHADPRNNFELKEIPNSAVALWHTHPSGCANLSVEDYHLFKLLPNLLHVIVGRLEVAFYFVDIDGAVLRREDV